MFWALTQANVSLLISSISLCGPLRLLTETKGAKMLNVQSISLELEAECLESFLK